MYEHTPHDLGYDLEIGEKYHEHGTMRLGLDEADLCARDHGERALGPADELGEVEGLLFFVDHVPECVSCGIFGDGRPRRLDDLGILFDQLGYVAIDRALERLLCRFFAHLVERDRLEGRGGAVGEDYVELADVLIRLAIAQSELAAGIVGDDPAHGAEAARSGVRWQYLAVGRQGRLFKITIVHTGLGNGRIIVDRADVIHVGGKDHRDRIGERPAGHVGARRATCDAHIFAALFGRVHVSDDRAHVRGVLGEDDDLWRALKDTRVAAVFLDRLGVIEHITLYLDEEFEIVVEIHRMKYISKKPDQIDTVCGFDRLALGHIRKQTERGVFSVENTSRYFGPNGICGKVNKEITPEFALKLGQSVGIVFGPGDDRRTVAIIGKEPRESGYMIEYALIAGFASVGLDSLLLGPMPAPAVSALTRSMLVDVGIMISAPGKSYQHNGIQLFGPDGNKVSNDIEVEIERLLDSDLASRFAGSGNLGRARRIDDARARYIEIAKHALPRKMDFERIRVVLDCANGAAYRVAPEILRELGAEVITIGDNPDGFNINHEVGSTSPDAMRTKVRATRADFGIALSGDGSEVVLADKDAKIIDHQRAVTAVLKSGIFKEAEQFPGDGFVTALRFLSLMKEGNLPAREVCAL